MHPAWRDGLAGLDRDPGLAPLLFQTPVRRIPVDIRSGPRLAEVLDPQERAHNALVAKLGAKSWRDGGSLRVINEGRPIASELANLLASLTSHQARYLDCIRPHVAQIELSLFRYVDFSRISEARWQVRAGRAWRTSQCRRNMPEALLTDAQDNMMQLALKVSNKLGRDAIVDCTIERSGQVRVLEVNPSVQRSRNGNVAAVADRQQDRAVGS
jgi:hypothetical protein